MKRTSYAVAAAFFAATGSASADAPKVVTDIAPVHGLVSRVMSGVGEPSLIVRPGSSPHHYSMRPSDARALDEADLVFWIGESLVPWLEQPIEELSTSAHVIELLSAKGNVTYEFRQGATFEAHDHDEHDDDHHDDHKDHDDHGHHEEHEEAHDHGDHGDHGDDDDHKDHAHEGHDDHHDEHGDEHGDDHDDEHNHAHDGVDPHAWLSATNGKLWLDVIAEELAEHDPENAQAYQDNAKAGKAELDAAITSISAALKPVQDARFVVFHDAYQYFEKEFDLAATGAISIGDASKPSAARIAEVQDTVRELNVSCVYTEPQFNKGLVRTIADGTGVKELEVDPLGTTLDLGPNFYVELLQSMGNSFAACK